MLKHAVFAMNHMRESNVFNSRNVDITCVWIVKETWMLLKLLHVVHYVIQNLRFLIAIVCLQMSFHSMPIA